MHELLFKLHLSIGLAIFLAGFGFILLRTNIFDSLVGLGLCLKVVCVLALVIARYNGPLMGVMNVLAFSTISIMILANVCGLGLGLRSLRSGGPLDLDKESELKN